MSMSNLQMGRGALGSRALKPARQVRHHRHLVISACIAPNLVLFCDVLVLAGVNTKLLQSVVGKVDNTVVLCDKQCVMDYQKPQKLSDVATTHGESVSMMSDRRLLGMRSPGLRPSGSRIRDCTWLTRFCRLRIWFCMEQNLASICMETRQEQ